MRRTEYIVLDVRFLGFLKFARTYFIRVCEAYVLIHKQDPSGNKKLKPLGPKTLLLEGLSSISDTQRARHKPRNLSTQGFSNSPRVELESPVR